MSEVNVVIAAKAAEVRNKSFSRFHAVVMKCPALPLSKTERNLQFDILEIPWGKSCRTFNSVQVICSKQQNTR